MRCMNVMQMQILKKNNFGHKRLKELTQGPYQTDSLRLSFLHPDSFRCKLGVGISIGISWISAIGSCTFDTCTFCLDACFKACNLK